MKTIARLEKLWEQDRRYTTRYMLVFAGSLFIHMMLAVLFAMMGRTMFALMNVASILVYLLWVELFARRPMSDGMLLVPYVDVVLHACVYNLYLGAAPAFFLYPFIIIPVTFFLAARDLKHKHTLVNSSALSVLSVLLMLATLSTDPKAPFADSGHAQQFFQVNALISALLLSVYTSEFMTETLSTQDSLSFHAENDQLTGLRNRYGFTKEVERIHGTQYCVIMCDIDDFKQVNDLYGHTVGDLLLAKIGKVLSGSVRKEDILCRWGGEEFLLVIRSDLETAGSAVERIRRKLSSVAVNAGDTAVSVTMTFGVADCLEAESFDELVKIADNNLLRGKRSGKNCLVASSDFKEINGNVQVPEAELDTSFLTERVFSAFSATSDTTYIYMCNLQTNVSRWSKTAVDYFGLPGEYMYDAANIWMGFVHPDDRKAYAQDVEAVISGRKHFHDVSYRARNRDGEYVHLSCKGVVTEGDAVHPAVFAGTITNLGPAGTATGNVR